MNVLALVLAVEEVAPWYALPETFWPGFVGSLVYGVVGVLLAVLGFKAFDWITPKIDIQKELAEKHNIAVAIVCAAIILGVCFIVGFVVD